MKKQTVVTALQNVDLIDLKIKEYKRRATVAGDKFKAASSENVDLRKSPEWSSIQESIKKLVDTKWALVMDTELFT